MLKLSLIVLLSALLPVGGVEAKRLVDSHMLCCAVSCHFILS